MFLFKVLRSLLISLPLLLCYAQAAVLNATWNVATDVAITAASYTATGHTVNFTLNHKPVTGRNLTVVKNTGLAFIQGTFGNLSQGQEIILTYAGATYKFVANYYGGSGNDLVLQWAGQSLTAWGWNQSGQLGNNSTAGTKVPVAVDATGVLSGKTVVAVSKGGGSHSFVICSDGTVAGWGWNDFGQLGNNGTGRISVPVAVTATGVLSGKTVVAVAAGGIHSLALCSDGTVTAWGYNNGGQLGNNSTARSGVPVAVDRTGVLSGKTVVAIAAGNEHSLALCSDGTIAAWGRNDSGQLGNNSTVAAKVPVAVDVTGVLNGRTVMAVAAGDYHSLALCSDGTVAVWGRNDFGQLGNNSTANSSVPVGVDATGVLSGKTVVTVGAGGNHSLALCLDGTVTAWGANDSGELGNNSTTSSSVPVAVDTTGVLNGKTVVAVSPGWFHSLALCSDGTVAAWGQNMSQAPWYYYGQLGNNSTTSSSVPVPVDTTGVLNGKTVVAVSAGGGYTLALTAALPNVSSLSGLTLSSGSLSPSFASGTTSYTTIVTNNTTSLTVTPTVTDPNATVRVNGNLVASGSASSPIPLTEGNNPVPVLVTAHDGMTVTAYAINVMRATTYDSWKTTAFTSQADRDNPAVSGPNANPAGDGITNLMKYALALNPLVCGTSDLPKPAVQAGYLTLTYRRNPLATDVTYTVEACDSPDGGWSVTNAVVSQVDMGGYWEVTLRDTVPIADSPRRFMRLKVNN